MDETPDSQPKPSSTLNDSGSSEGETENSRRFSSYLQSIAQISGVVTIVAATVYALGVFTLVLPISNSYNSTFDAAWYAVSVVPQTVVVGHGIKSLVWPSLALTLATTLFALTMLWVLYTLSIGWHHARAATARPALSPYSMMMHYAVLSIILTTILVSVTAIVFGSEAVGSGRYRESGVGYYVGTYINSPAIGLAAVLCGLSYLVASFFVVVVTLRGTSQLIRRKTLPPISSWRGFIYKVLPFAVASTVVFFSVGVLVPTRSSLGQIARDMFLFSLAYIVLFSLAVAMALMLRLLRYIRNAHLIQEVRRSKTVSPLLAPYGDLSASVAQLARRLSPTFPYSVVLFIMLYLALLVALSTLNFVGFLTDEVRGEIKAESTLDDILIPLVALGALVSGVILYRKDWKGFGRSERDHVSQGSWVWFSKELLRSIGSRSLRSGLLWSVGVAYGFALVWAFLLAELTPPPLPKVEVKQVPHMESAQSVQEPGFQGKTLALLAHTDGYWYLIDEGEDDLLVVPDQEDKFIRLQLDEQPK